MLHLIYHWRTGYERAQWVAAKGRSALNHTRIMDSFGVFAGTCFFIMGILLLFFYTKLISIYGLTSDGQVMAWLMIVGFIAMASYLTWIGFEGLRCKCWKKYKKE